jgi:hypothetical protein
MKESHLYMLSLGWCCSCSEAKCKRKCPAQVWFMIAMVERTRSAWRTTHELDSSGPGGTVVDATAILAQ